MTTVKTKYFHRQQVVALFDYYSGIDIFVVIPVFADELIFKTLNSLTKTDFIDKKRIGVIVVVNHAAKTSISDKKKNEEIFSQLQKTQLPFHLYTIFKKNIANSIAGVGYARKIGMDQAAFFFFEQNNPFGIIVSLDADTTVKKNYFTEILQFFKKHPDAVGGNIFFEHPLNGTSHDEEIYNAITLYELHLRYFVESLRHIHFPYSFHTVGSAFAVRAKNYVASQGMSMRQGGEDFYFLNKLFNQGFFGEINSTTVFPSPRANNKTPFGTGIAVKKILENPEEPFNTYCLDAFLCLKEIIDKVNLLWETDASIFLENEISTTALKLFLQKQNFCENIGKLKKNSTSFPNFKTAFYRWFNSFTIIKFLNETARTGIFHRQEITKEANKLVLQNLSSKELLLFYRKYQKRI